MRSLRQYLMVSVVVAALACLAGCTHPGSPERSGITSKPLRFIFITTCADEDFFKPVKKGVRDAAAQVGVQCTFTGTPEVDIKVQAEMVRKAVAERYDGIALNIIDPVAFDGVVSEAMGKGIPVVAFNVETSSPTYKATIRSFNCRPGARAPRAPPPIAFRV